MEKLQNFYQNSIKKVLNKLTESFRDKSNVNKIVDICALMFFSLAFLSIPLCSFKVGLNKITWIFSILFLVLMTVSIILDGIITIDKISISLILFVIWITICLIVNINLHSKIVITPIFLSIVTFIIYTYLSRNKKYRNMYFNSLLYSLTIFMIVYIMTYYKELISLNFTRLGDKFGNINDIAISFGIGFSVCFSFILHSKFNILRFLILFALLFLFGFCGLSTGSKIFVLIITASMIFSIFVFMRTKKLKWYWYIISALIVFLVAIVVLNLPAFETMKERIFMFLNPKSKDKSTDIRFTMFVDGIYMFLRRPLFGFGISGFFSSSSFGNCWSHNNFSELLCSYGMIGFILFYIPYILVIKNIINGKSNKLNDFSSVIMIVFICCMFSVALESQKVFAYSIAIFYSLYESEQIELLNINKLKSKKNTK